jgi:hypothetical protein
LIINSTLPIGGTCLNAVYMPSETLLTIGDERGHGPEIDLAAAWGRAQTGVDVP